MNLWEILGLAVLAMFLVARFAPGVWRIISLTLRIAIFAGATFAAVAGIALLMNNETIFEEPGAGARIHRFLTVNQAATSKKGLGSATCARDQSPAQKGKARGEAQAPAAGASTPAAGEPAPPEREDYYPELVTRGYPGIPRAKLFAMAKDTAGSLGGWRIVTSDPRDGSIDCVYTTRFLGFEDDVRIKVTRKNEIELCSESRIGEPGSNSPLRFFHGDFAANIGHIKEFYAALQPRVDAFYSEVQRRQQAGY